MYAEECQKFMKLKNQERKIVGKICYAAQNDSIRIERSATKLYIG